VSKNYIAKIIAALTVLTLVFSTVLLSQAEEDPTNPVPSEIPSQESSVVASSDSSSAVEGTPSEDTGVSSSQVTSQIASSEVVSSQEASSVETVSSTPVQSVESTTSSKVSSKVTSSKKNTSSKKKTSSKKQTATSSRSESSYQATTGTTTSYDYGYQEEGSDKWEGESTELESNESEGKELSEHLFDFERFLKKWIWIPIVVSIICAGVLIYVNLYLYKNGKHTARGVEDALYEQGSEEYDDSEIDFNQDSEMENEPEVGDDDDDPYSAENFFKFED